MSFCIFPTVIYVIAQQAAYEGGMGLSHCYNFFPVCPLHWNLASLR